MKPMAMRPVIMNVIPRPRRPGGTFEYFSRSRIAASAMIASQYPTPETKPKPSDNSAAPGSTQPRL